MEMYWVAVNEGFLLHYVFVALLMTRSVVSQDTSEDLCRNMCDCHWTQEGFSIHCIAKSMQAIPRGIPPNVTNLEFSFNNLRELGEESFPEPLPHLRRLDLRMCTIQTLGVGTFSHLSALIELALDHNQIKEIKHGTFQGLVNLQILSLNNNDLIYLDTGVFEGLSLKHLNLYDNHHLLDIHPDVFKNASVGTLSLDSSSLSNLHEEMLQPLKSSLSVLHWSYNNHPLSIPYRLFDGLWLESLRLTNNMITNTTFLDNTHAQHIDLSNNNLQTFNFAGHKGLTSVETLILKTSNLYSLFSEGVFLCVRLRELDVSHNHLSFIKKEIFRGMTNLTRLYLVDNSIHYLAESLTTVFHTLVILDVSDNDLTCNCSMEWFRRWKSLSSRTVVYGGTCVSPTDHCEAPSIRAIEDSSTAFQTILSCEAHGLPLPHITWKFNFSNFGPFHNDSPQLNFSSNASAHRTVSTLQIDQTPPKRTCIHFICNARSSLGVHEESFKKCDHNEETKGPRDRPKLPLPKKVSYLPPLIGVITGITLSIISVTVVSRLLRYRRAQRHGSRLSTTEQCYSERTLIEDCEDDKGPFCVETV